MFARTTLVQFKPGTLDQATHFVQNIMLPTASKQQGFRGALFFMSETDAQKYIIISMWETPADMLASQPPKELISQLQAYTDLIADLSQDTYEVLLHIERPPS
ncbi:MAG TPA: antibiotic biosynthesis monooxygenase [Ktedonobacteraceae bacterium]|nr:antibiotic biosynthesis monooxygenase [Ktedonobacteraceae bacterium]